MIHDIFLYNNRTNRVELNIPEILLVKEFKALVQPERNKCRKDTTGKQCLKAYREFTYIWLAYSWKSLYSDYEEEERLTEARKDAELTDKEFDDPLFQAACKKFCDMQNSNKSIRLLQAANEMVDKFIKYFSETDPMERDDKDRPVYKVKDIQAEMKNLVEVHRTMVELESQVKKEIAEESSIRAGARNGYRPHI